MASSPVSDRLRSLGRTALLGGVLGIVLPLVLLGLGWPLRSATTLSFSIGGLAFGFGLTIWAGSLMSGTSIAAAGEHLGRSFDVEKTTGAMGVLASFGGAWMVGTTLLSIALGP
ncbi:MAG: hypothetical protein ABEJ58_01005 [Halodesulfurarchaeum sp.]